jgi:hypothetical protein
MLYLRQRGNPVNLTIAYRHDDAHQLTEVRHNSYTGNLLEAYLHDGAGQRTQKCAGGTVTRPSDTSLLFPKLRLGNQDDA